MYYFYRTVNTVNGMYYYGVGHKNNYLGSGKYFKRALKKYGSSNFNKDILKWFETPEQAFLFEDRFLKFFKLKENSASYNLCNNSFGGDTMPPKGTKEYKDRIKQMSRTATINNYKVWAARTSDERKKIGGKISESKGTHTEERKKEIYLKYKQSFLNDNEKMTEWKKNASASAKRKYERMSNDERSAIAKKTVESRKKALDAMDEDSRKKTLKDRHASAIGKQWYYAYIDGILIEKLLKEKPSSDWKLGRPSTSLRNKEKNMIKIRKLEEPQPVFDITVDGNENFYANDILVHNCSKFWSSL